MTPNSSQIPVEVSTFTFKNTPTVIQIISPSLMHTKHSLPFIYTHPTLVLQKSINPIKNGSVASQKAILLSE